MRDGSGTSSLLVECKAVSLLLAECHLPGNSDYQPTDSETLQMAVEIGNLVNHSSGMCSLPPSGTLTATLHVNADVTSTQGSAATAVDVVGTTAGGGGTIVSVLGGASMLDLHTLAMLMSSPCASLLDQKRVNYMMYVLSPFYSLGNVAVVFGNMAVTGIVTLLQVLVAWYFRSSRNIPTLAACAAVYFPSLAMKISELMYVGVTVCAYLLLSSTSTPLEIVVGIIGMAYVLGIPTAVVATIHYKVNARMIQYTQFLSRGVLQRLLLPWGFWTPEVMSRAYGRHIGGFLPGFRMYLSAYPMIVVAAAAVFTHMLPMSVDCFLRFIFVAIIFFIAAIALIATRPHRIHATTGFASSMFLVLGVLSVVLALAYRSPSEALEVAKLILCAVAVLLTIARIIFDGVTTYFEWKYWRHFREQNHEAMQDGGVVGSASERVAYDLDVLDLDDIGGGSEMAQVSSPKKRDKVGTTSGQAAPLGVFDLVQSEDDNIAIVGKSESSSSLTDTSSSNGSHEHSKTTPTSAEDARRSPTHSISVSQPDDVSMSSSISDFDL